METPQAPRGPNPAKVAWSVLRALATVRRPQPSPDSTETVDHGPLAVVLTQVKTEGAGSLPEQRAALATYRSRLEAVDPDTLARSEALAYWLNLYNAGALDLAAEAFARRSVSVLRVPGGFQRTWAVIADTPLSLDAIEHAKIRRFKDPRIHGALICGSASCPTLRHEPYLGDALVDQLDAQMSDFLANGGAVLQGRTLYLSRILAWFGADFVKPQRMPAFVPARKRAVAEAVRPWLSRAERQALAAGDVEVAFQPYDWSLACSIG